MRAATRYRFAPEAALAVAALLYGITFPLVHDALADITPFAYLFGRFTVAALLLAPAAVLSLRRHPESHATIVRAGIIAGALLFGGYAAQTAGLEYTNASTSAFITGLCVIFVPVLDGMLRRRMPPRPVMAGVALGTVGLYLLTGAHLALGLGELLTLLCAVFFAGHIVCLGAYASRVPSTPFTVFQLAAVALLAFPPTAIGGTGDITAFAVFAVVFTGVACSAVALPLQLWGQRRISATRAALVLMLEPVFAGIAAHFDGDHLSAVQVLGAAVILTGIAVSELTPRAAPRPAVDAAPVRAPSLP
jgi:drug/metabolite transporter (DMT)-like permease